MRREFELKSSEIYLCPKHLRNLNVELKQRNCKDTRQSHPEHKHKSDAERTQAYDSLKAKNREAGLLSKHPILVMLLRKDDVKTRFFKVTKDFQSPLN